MTQEFLHRPSSVSPSLKSLGLSSAALYSYNIKEPSVTLMQKWKVSRNSQLEYQLYTDEVEVQVSLRLTASQSVCLGVDPALGLVI
jgi:hypothetical protein